MIITRSLYFTVTATKNPQKKRVFFFFFFISSSHDQLGKQEPNANLLFANTLHQTYFKKSNTNDKTRQTNVGEL